MAKRNNTPLFTDITNVKKGTPTEANLKSVRVETNGQATPTYTSGVTNSNFNNLKSNPVIVQTKGPGVSAPANLSGPKKK